MKNCSCVDCECVVNPDGTCGCNSISVSARSTSFWNQVKNSYPSAVGIIVLCVLSSQLGQGISFVLFGYHDLFGIVMSYTLGYVLASFSTFCTIIGRYNPKHGIGGCCSALEQGENVGFVKNIKNTFRDCLIGIKKILHLKELPNATNVIKTSIYILITAESACILTAETVNLAFFRHAMWLSMPLGLLAAAFVVTVIEIYKIRHAKKKIN
ncbi:MAG TPA: hypothetical protein VJ571_03635 [Candidatus Nitrosotalea sp.]|nr:hypothetical protein [Candidatus Nitrosotalea sp.]